ncbi:MAG: cupin domain-containing protein [Opitutales bacterium]|nr:cupin domain-containing protein [Opitutales bacterium]
MVEVSAATWRSRLGLARHPEGGWFRRVYASRQVLPQAVLSPEFKGPRPQASAIYYLLEGEEVSHFHRIASDEIWHHYDGAELSVVELTPEGVLTVHRLGKNPEQGAVPFCVIPAGHWFGALLPSAGKSHALVGCTVIPGFDFAEHEMGNRQDLLEEYPEHHEWILRLTQDAGEPDGR